jgi:hypothetical protein
LLRLVAVALPVALAITVAAMRFAQATNDSSPY